jgi:hypothetical protein
MVGEPLRAPLIRKEAIAMETHFNQHDTPLPLEFFEHKYQISRTTLWRYRRAGLPAIGVGAKTFIRESDFVAFLRRMDGQTVNANPKGQS